MLGGKLAGGEDKTIIIQSPPPAGGAESPAPEQDEGVD